MRDEILALLEPGPCALAELAGWLEQPDAHVTKALRLLNKAALVKRLAHDRWALITYLEPPVRSKTTARRRAAALVDDRLLIEEPPAAGDAVCARCGTRFVRERAADQFCSTLCAETPPPSDTRTIVDEGIEFEATSIGRHELTHWPDDAPTRGSSLSGRTYGVRH